MATRGSKRVVRVAAGLILVVGAALLAGSALADPGPAVEGAADATGVTAAIGDDDRGLTVVTTQGFYTRLHPGDRDTAELVAFDADGDVVYHNTTYPVYFDVDPVPGTRATVEYVAAELVKGPACDTDACSLNLVERVNLTTGETTRLYAAVTPQYQTGRWHDVDRLNETHLAVADIVEDRVYVVDLRSGRITWQWGATELYGAEEGGPPGDWTHLNDLELLEDGRVMASVRNMDSVVFIDPAAGVDDAWTLGADGDQTVLHEPHNPDFLPGDRGGPAVLVADSENNRVVEYHRRDGDWTPAWSWRDRRLQWPRDADRLPNGHTLIVDSHGDRVLEIDPAGAVVWSVEVGRPYDAERLDTGDESAGGHAAGSKPDDPALGAPPAAHQRPDPRGLVVGLKDALPARAVNGLLFVAPPWVGFTDLLVAAGLLADLAVWGGVEWRWSRRSVLQLLRRTGR